MNAPSPVLPRLLCVVALLAVWACERPRARERAVEPEPTKAASAAPVSHGDFDPAKVIAVAGCGSIDGGRRSTDGAIFLWGWAIDRWSEVPAAAVVVLDHGRQVGGRIAVDRERPDVAKAKDNQRLLASGWNATIPGPDAAESHSFEAYAVIETGELCRLSGKVTELLPQ